MDAYSVTPDNEAFTYYKNSGYYWIHNWVANSLLRLYSTAEEPVKLETKFVRMQSIGYYDDSVFYSSLSSLLLIALASLFAPVVVRTTG